MQEYISREYLQNIINYYLANSVGAEHYGYNQINLEINFVPVADVIKVKHGYWKVLGQRTYGGGKQYTHYCSECGQHGYDDYKICPDCGAKMDGGGENA